VVFGEHSNITNLGAQAFANCFALTSITLPNNLEVIEEMTFDECTSLERVVFNKNLKTIGENAFQYCSVVKSITLPNNLEVMEKQMFNKCTSLERVVFNKHLKTIGNAAFDSCSALTSITLPNELEVIEEMTFYECSALDCVVFNKNLKTIGDRAFQFCSALTSITLPDNLEAIEECAICACTSLKSVVCNKNLKTIGDGAFQQCTKLEDVQIAPSSISFVKSPFGDCDRLIEVADAAGFPSKPRMNMFGDMSDFGDGIAPYLIDRFERNERKQLVLLAHMRFNNAIHAHVGSEEEKVAAAKLLFSNSSPTCDSCGAEPQKLLSCGACNLAHYCNKQCQVNGWNKHKKDCKRARKRKKKADYSNNEIKSAKK